MTDREMSRAEADAAVEVEAEVRDNDRAVPVLTDEEAIAEILAAHQPSGSSGIGVVCACGQIPQVTTRFVHRDYRAHVASILATHVAAAKAEAWDECCKGFAWALDNGPDEMAIQYVRDHNPYGGTNE